MTRTYGLAYWRKYSHCEAIVRSSWSPGARFGVDICPFSQGIWTTCWTHSLLVSFQLIVVLQLGGLLWRIVSDSLLWLCAYLCARSGVFLAKSTPRRFMDFGHLLPQPLLCNFGAHTNFDKSHSQRVVRGKCTGVSSSFISSHMSSASKCVRAQACLHSAAVWLTKHSWQSHQYSGYFAIALQLLVAGELPVSSTFLGAFHLLVFSALYDASICSV